jgi:hypothetical protein
MAYDDPKLPRAVLRGENLYIDGENEPYFRDPGYPVYLEVTDLRISGGFFGKGDSPKQPAAVTLRGRAKLEGKDKFAVAGVKTDRSPPIEFYLRHVLENETKFHWRATIGFQMYDWEFEDEEGFWVQGYCTGQPVRRYRRRRADGTCREAACRLGNDDVDQAKVVRLHARHADDIPPCAARR